MKNIKTKDNDVSGTLKKTVSAEREVDKNCDRALLSIDLSEYPNLCAMIEPLAAIDASLQDVVLEQIVAVALGKAEKEARVMQ